MKYRGGRLVDKENFFIGDEYEPREMRRDFLLSYYPDRDDIPKEIYIDEEFDDMELVTQLLREKAGHAVKFVVPQRRKRTVADSAREEQRQRVPGAEGRKNCKGNKRA